MLSNQSSKRCRWVVAIWRHRLVIRLPLAVMMFVTCTIVSASPVKVIAQTLRPPAVRAARDRPHADDATLAASGIRKVMGRQLTLYTDLPVGEAVDQLPQVFDRAMPLWHRHFRTPAAPPSDWHLTAYLMRNDRAFRDYGLLPESLPEFLHGFQRGNEFWLREQPSDFYRCHLLLHEGTHAYMNRWLGGVGPVWFGEGMAELLGTHRRQDDKLMLGVIPVDRDEAAYWGRIKLVCDDIAKGRILSLREVMSFRIRSLDEVNNVYAWSWAAVIFLTQHPLTRDAAVIWPSFLAQDAAEFNRRVLTSMQPRLTEIEDAWALFLHQLDYGYDVAEDEVMKRDARELASDGAVIEITSSRGWQSAGYRVQAGQRYRLSATGRFQLGASPQPWFSEPAGVTIHYHRGQPIGKLLMVVRPSSPATRDIPDAKTRPTSVAMKDQVASWDPIAVGDEFTWQSAADGQVYFRINEPAGRLADNAGQIQVRLQPMATAEPPSAD